jgi:hypothetical protein
MKHLIESGILIVALAFLEAKPDIRFNISEIIRKTAIMG